MNHYQNLSQQIKQINSIEHQKISGTIIIGELESSVGNRKHRSNNTPVDSINQFSQYSGSAMVLRTAQRVSACDRIPKRITDNIFDNKRVKTLKSSFVLQ
ncbi:hypothetical protein [Dapis sp. BLCC M229]|uniref:hypothetical protein n=1 Tax=Dapis sp. BLCC M229 TaxID=3400188 RepID=UPI003CEF2729